MAFDKSNFARMSTSANSSIPTLWGYSTADATTVVDGAGYFNNVSGDVKVGDLIMANTSTGGTLASGIYQVSSNASGVVDTNNALVVTATDSD